MESLTVTLAIGSTYAVVYIGVSAQAGFTHQVSNQTHPTSITSLRFLRVRASLYLPQAEMPVGKCFAVGYALEPNKEHTFMKDSLLEYGKQRGVEFIQIDLNKPLIEQGPFDCVVHKVYGEDWSNQLAEYSAKHPNAVIVDPPHMIEKLLDRGSMLEVVTQLSMPQKDVSFGVPQQVVVRETEALMAGNGLGAFGLKFPVIAKPLLVDGSLKSHELCLVFDDAGLKSLIAPTILQQFVNHGGVVFKIYAAGEQVTCVKRASLPDIPDEKLKTLSGTLLFSQISSLAAEQNGHDSKTSSIEQAEMPPMSFIRGLAKGLKEAMGLNLFNLDVIRDANDRNRYLILDINYFPGFAKLPKCEPFLTDFFLDILSKKKTT